VSRAAFVLIVKYLATLAIAVFSFRYVGYSPLGWIAVLSVTVATLNYLLSDFYILPRLGNYPASLTSGVLAGISAYFANVFIPLFQAGAGALFVFAILTVLEEYFLHRYLMQERETRP